MSQSKSSPPGKPQSWGLSRQGNVTNRQVPAPPPMQVVTKGWWTLRDELVSVDKLSGVGNGGK